MVAKDEFPTRENCDPSVPEEAFLWMLVALPYQNGGQLVMPVEYLKLVSKRLWDLGARPVEEPVIEYVRPSAASPHWLTDPGKFVPKGQGQRASDEAMIDASLAKMAHRQRTELYQALVAAEQGRDLPSTPAGQVVSSLSDSQRAQILGRMRDAA
jgi:hypothetical protein